MSLPAAMDFSKIRKTQDGKVSVVDVIAQIKKCKSNYAAQVYQRLLEEERVPKCEVRNIAHTAPERSTARCSRPTTSTPIATAAEITEIIWQLPGASDFRKNCAKVCVRYLGGDESLVEEVRMNRRLQEQLREEAPEHPARLFGEAVESQVESEALKRKREELELKKLTLRSRNSSTPQRDSESRTMSNVMAALRRTAFAWTTGTDKQSKTTWIRRYSPHRAMCFKTRPSRNSVSVLSSSSTPRTLALLSVPSAGKWQS